MPQVQILGGIGQTEIIIKEAGITKYSHTFMLAQLNGYARRVDIDQDITELISLDIFNPVKYRVAFKTGYWNNWSISWKDFPLPLAEQKAVLNMINAKTNSRRMYINPKVGFGYLEEVNLMNESVLLQSLDTAQSRGVYGIEMLFQSVQTQPSIIYIVPPIDPVAGFPGTASRPTYELGPN